jgi:hypothetical protein
MFYIKIVPSWTDIQCTMNSNTRDLTPTVAAFVSPPMTAMTFNQLGKPTYSWLNTNQAINEPTPNNAARNRFSSNALPAGQWAKARVLIGMLTAPTNERACK